MFFDWMLLWGTTNGSLMASLEDPLNTFIFKSICLLKAQISIKVMQQFFHKS